LFDRLLDLIARAYLWFYHKLLQRPRDEPFTRQFDRMERFFYPFAWGLVLVVLFWASHLHWLWAVCFNLAAAWFIHHIIEYRVAHPENVPYLKQWAERRLNVRSH